MDPKRKSYSNVRIWRKRTTVPWKSHGHLKKSFGMRMFMITNPLHRIEFSSKFFRKRSFFNQNQQPLNDVEPFERIFRALFIAQCPYKFSSFLDLKNGSSRFRLFAHDFRLIRFFFSGFACYSKVAPPGKLQRWVKYDGKFASFGKEFRWTKFNAVERVTPVQPVPWKIRLSMLVGILIEILNGG